jgi:hypothetical protein
MRHVGAVASLVGVFAMGILVAGCVAVPHEDYEVHVSPKLEDVNSFVEGALDWEKRAGVHYNVSIDDGICTGSACVTVSDTPDQAEIYAFGCADAKPTATVPHPKSMGCSRSDPLFRNAAWHILLLRGVDPIERPFMYRHEIGHTLGLVHTCDEPNAKSGCENEVALMNPIIQPDPNGGLDANGNIVKTIGITCADIHQFNEVRGLREGFCDGP